MLRGATLACGDYAVLANEEVHAAVERKTHDDLVKALLDGSLAFALADLSELPHAAVAAETRYDKLLAEPRVQPGWLAEVVARLTVRYPSVPLVLCDSRKLAEDFTHRFLAAAVASGGAGPGRDPDELALPRR